MLRNFWESLEGGRIVVLSVCAAVGESRAVVYYTRKLHNLEY